MGEQLKHIDSGEKLDLDIDIKKNLEESLEKAAESKEISPDQIEQIRQHIEKQAISGKEIGVDKPEAAPSLAHATHKELKDASYNKTLKSVQKHLHGPEKAFSKTIHKPAIERLSNLSAATIARPLGLASAGFVTLLGSIVVLFLAKRYGFNYNYSIYIILFAAGYLLGLVIEVLGSLLKRRR